MLLLLIILIIIAAILLVIIVLAQNPKGGGLAQGFSGSNQYMGVQNTNKFLTKATWSLIGFIGLASIITASLAIPNEETQGSKPSVDITNVKQPQAPKTNPGSVDFQQQGQAQPAPAPAQ